MKLPVSAVAVRARTSKLKVRASRSSAVLSSSDVSKIWSGIFMSTDISCDVCRRPPPSLCSASSLNVNSLCK